MTTKREIVRIMDEDGYLGYHDEWNGTEQPAEGMYLEELADLCDREAQSRNNYTYAGTHRILAALLHRHLGREQATDLMREVAEYGGLDGMGGVGGGEDAFGDFGIPDFPKVWALS